MKTNNIMNCLGVISGCTIIGIGVYNLYDNINQNKTEKTNILQTDINIKNPKSYNEKCIEIDKKYKKLSVIDISTICAGIIATVSSTTNIINSKRKEVIDMSTFICNDPYNPIKDSEIAF